MPDLSLYDIFQHVFLKLFPTLLLVPFFFSVSITLFHVLQGWLNNTSFSLWVTLSRTLWGWNVRCFLLLSMSSYILWGLANLSVYNISSLINATLFQILAGLVCGLLLSQCYIMPKTCEVVIMLIFPPSKSRYFRQLSRWCADYSYLNQSCISTSNTFHIVLHASPRMAVSVTLDLWERVGLQVETLSKGTKASDLTELQTRTVSTAFRYEQGNETLLPRPFFFQWLVNTVPKVETLSEGPTAPAPVNIHLGDVFRNERRNDAQTPQQRFPFYFSDKLALLPESWGRLGEGPQRITEF